MLESAIWVIAVAGLLASSGFTMLACLAAARGLRFTAQAGAIQAPPVSVLKPLAGMEPGLRENLETFFLQEYGEFELLFAAERDDDPALAIVKSLRDHYRERPVRVVITGAAPYPNAKVFSLRRMAEIAAHEVLVVSDSDVSVSPDYLTRVVAPFSDDRVGAVTCLYRGVPREGPWSFLEALGMSVEMAAGVLTANLLEGMRFTLGPTMAFRKHCLAAIGGLDGVGDYCADDFELGKRIAENGFQVVLSDHIVNHHVLNTTFDGTISHQIRWMRSARYSRPLGHVGQGLTFSVPFGLLGVLGGLLSGNYAAGFALLAWACLNGWILCLAVGWGVVRDRNARAAWWLYPLRELLGFVAWCASFVNAPVVWRNRSYVLQRGGRMSPAS